MHRHKIWARGLQNLRGHEGTPIEVFSQWAMWHWASRSGENVQRRFGFFQVKRTTFAFTTDSRVSGVWHFRIWRQWFGNLLAVPWKLPPKTIKRTFFSGKAVTITAVTNAVSERLFSAFKRVNTYLRWTMGDSRLNHLMMLHVDKDRTDALTFIEVANDFVREKENRKQLFDKFCANDIPNKFSISSKSTQTENLKQNKRYCTQL